MFNFSLNQIADRTEFKCEERNLKLMMMMGVEVGGLDSFYSFERPSIGLLCKEESLARKLSDQHWDFTSNVILPTARFRIDEIGTINPTGFTRSIILTSTGQSLLMDCVIRFVIHKTQIKEAVIGNSLIPHQSRNFYHQYKNQPVTLIHNSGKSINFHAIFDSVPTGISPVVYLRDEKDFWVLHFRALAADPTHFIFKGCHALYNKAFPNWMQAIIANSEFLRKHLLYVRERVSQRIPFQVNGAVPVQRGGQIAFRVVCEID